MIVVTDDVAVLPMSKKEDNVSSSPSSTHAADESTAATSSHESSTRDSQRDLAGMYRLYLHWTMTAKSLKTKHYCLDIFLAAPWLDWEERFCVFTEWFQRCS